MPRIAPSYLRGRLARRLLTVFLLAAVLPVLITSLIAYTQLLSAARAARSERLHQTVEAVSLAFLAELQDANAQLGSARAADARVHSWLQNTGLERVHFLPLVTRAERLRALASESPAVRRAIAAHRSLISWTLAPQRRTGLVLTRMQRDRKRLVRARIDVPRLLARAAAADPGVAVALVAVNNPQHMILSAAAPVAPAVFEQLAHHAPNMTGRRSFKLGNHAWLAASWDLFLRSTFIAPTARIVLVEPRAATRSALRQLRWMIPLALLAATAFAMLLAIRQLRRYLGPLEILTSATRRLMEHKEHVRVSIDTGDELTMLGEDFNKMAEELLRQANFDGLTQLANREFFRSVLAARLSAANERRDEVVLLYIDLDAFKEINDTAGHAAGDAVLIEVAARLRAKIGPDDFLARLGGDEFAVIVATRAQPEYPYELAQRILRELDRPFDVRGTERRLSASIGMARAPQHGQTVEHLLRNADIAMYAAKAQGRATLVQFDAQMYQRRKRELALEVELRRAREREELDVFYQPIVRGTRIIGVEALARWRRKSGEFVSPGIFVPIAERIGIIGELGEWVLRRACRDFASWQRAGVELEHFSVNVSPSQLFATGFVAMLSAVLESHELLPQQLQIEITESAIAEGAQVQQVLREISTLGVRVALDDFGTGYSSLSELHRLPIDVVKIDQSFIAELPDNLVGLQFVRAIVNMAHGLGHEVIVEGVENDAQRELLEKIGCDAMQGYLFGRPMAEAAVRLVVEAASGCTGVQSWG